LTNGHANSERRGESAPLVDVRGLSKEYVQQKPLTREKFVIRAVENANLTIQRGATTGLMGESGSGKSTLVRCIALIEKHTRGEIRFEGANAADFQVADLSRLRREVQIIFQDAASALNPRLTAAAIVMEPLEIQRKGTKSQRRERALELLERVGLSASWEHKKPFEFSGGQRQRLALARALALEPKLLIFDEALSHLDLASQESMLELLARFKDERQLTYLHVSHDLEMLRYITDEIAVMCEGTIVEQKPTTEIFAHPEHSHTRDLLRAMPPLETICRERFTHGSP
jgi:peptide/nickel transport system ATP-binding protein